MDEVVISPSIPGDLEAVDTSELIVRGPAFAVDVGVTFAVAFMIGFGVGVPRDRVRSGTAVQAQFDRRFGTYPFLPSQHAQVAAHDHHSS